MREHTFPVTPKRFTFRVGRLFPIGVVRVWYAPVD